jgi:hypothetical protein
MTRRYADLYDPSSMRIKKLEHILSLIVNGEIDMNVSHNRWLISEVLKA